ncbi:MAG: tetratricopeptide repeat protein [Pirellula sp.]|jgi:tetratricopeptide (TPR) repeat protein
MIKINRKLLAISLLATVLLGGAVFGIRAWQLTKQSSFYFELARKFKSEGEFANAVNQFRRGLALEPKNFDAQWDLAISLESLGNFEPAYTAAQKAEQLRIDNKDVQKLLGNLALRIGRFDDAQRRASALLVSDPKNPELLLLRGRAQFASKNVDAALLDYREVSALPDAPVEALVELATILAESKKQYDESLTVASKLLSHPDGSAAVLAHGRWCTQQYARRSISTTLEGIASVEKLLDLAKQDVENLLKQAGDLPSSYAFAARVASLSNDLERSLEHVDAGLVKFPNDIELYGLGAASATASGKTEVAEKYLTTGLERAPTDNSLLWELANLMLEKKSFKEGRDALARLKINNYQQSLVAFLDARFFAGEGKHLDAIRQFEAVRSTLVDSPELQRIIDLELAKSYEAIGNRSRQIAALRRAVSLNTGWLAAREQLAIALLAAGRIEEATEEYRSLANRPGVPIGAPLNLARLMVMQNLARDPNLRDWNAVDELLNRIEAAGGDKEEITILRAESQLAQDKPDAARELLKTVSDTDRGVAAAILLEVNQGQSAAADEILDANQLKLDSSSEVRRAAILRWLSAIDASSSDRIAKLILPPESWQVTDRIGFLAEVVPIVIRSESFGIAKVGLTLLEQLDPTNLVAKSSLLEIASREKNKEEMLKALSQIEGITGRSATWYYGQALASVVGLAQISKEDNAKAQTYLAEAEVLTPDWPDVPAFSANLHDASGDSDTAVVKYIQAFDLGWRRIETIQRLLGLLAQKGRYSEADSIIRRASQANPSLSSSMSRMASEISAQLANLQRAIALAQDAAEKSQSAKDYVWLAQLRDINRETEAAEQAYRKSLELAPNDAAIQVAWVRFLSRTARLEQARQSVRLLEQQIDQSKPSEQLMLAECFLSLGMQTEIQRIVGNIKRDQLQGLGEHRRYYDLFVGISQSQDRTSWLESFLTKGVSNPSVSTANTDKSSDDLVSWARRQLALEWITAGRNYEQAKQLLGANLALAPKSWEDRRALAILLAVTSGVDKPQEAITMFESLMAEGWKPQGDDGFFLGELYVKLGDWSKGSRYFLQVLGNAERRQPRYLKRYATLLLSRKDPKEAELWVDRLREEGVQDAETANLLAEVRFQRKQWDDLFDVLVGDGKQSLEKDWFETTLSVRERYELASTVLTRLKTEEQKEIYERLLPRVEKMGEKLAESSDFPGAFYATQLLSRGETKKAISALERVLNSTKLDDLASFIDTVLQRTDVATEDFKRLEGMVRSTDGFGQNNGSKVIAARLCEQQGDFPGGIELYRSILADDPNNAVALNNLANLLALTKSQLPESLQLIERAIKNNGETPYLIDTRAVCRLASSDIAGALKDMELAVGVFPHPYLRFHLSWVLLTKGDKAAAKKQFDLAIKDGLQIGQVHVLERPVFEQLKSLP